MSNKPKIKAGRDHKSMPVQPPVNQRLWHYTHYHNFLKIVESKEIRTTSIGIHSKELPAAWFSSNPFFEQSARKASKDRKTGVIRRNLGPDEMLAAGHPAVRIEINPSKVKVYPWRLYKEVSGLPNEYAVNMEKAGMEMGANHSEWYASFQPVSLPNCFLPIEIWNGRGWVDIEKVNIETKK